MSPIMKAFFYLFVSSLLITYCTSTKNSNNSKNSIFIIPLQGKSLICSFKNNTIKELGSFPKTINSKSIIVNDKYICSIDSLISIFDINGKLLKQIQSDFIPSCLNSKGNVVYLGGSNKNTDHKVGEIFAILDLGNGDFTLELKEIPIKLSYGKSIDDILIFENKLILVDNIVYPKYLLEYDITDLENPKHVMTNELANHGTYEHIIKGELNKDWLILLSSTTGRLGSSDHISIKKSITDMSSSSISAHQPNYWMLRKSEGEYDEASIKDFSDICLMDNMLYVLVDSSVYSLDLETEHTAENLKKVPSKLSSIQKIIHFANNRMVFIGRNNNYELYE
jgi:hypothetical protein